MTTIKDLKQKILDAMNEVDLSKVSIDELQKYTSTLGNLDLIAKEPDKTYKEMIEKIANVGCTYKPRTIESMKGE
jgi:hypothetical protein